MGHDLGERDLEIINTSNELTARKVLNLDFLVLHTSARLVCEVMQKGWGGWGCI